MLELDIGYQLLGEIKATKKAWKVLKDKSDSVDLLMQDSWVENRQKFKQEILVDK